MAHTFDQYSMILNGRHTVLRSGAMHYFRLPHPNLWWDRLQKLKAANYNTIDLYFSWDFHSPAPGKYDFTGIRDIKRLLDMVEDLGLWLIARPGPYINAETTRGGLPGWLLREPDVILRNRIDGAFQYSPRYMAFVREWLDHLLPYLKNSQNMLMIQVENEYATVEMEPDYMQELIDITRAHGIHVPTMHNDFYAAGLYADLVDIYAVDNYSVTAFDMNWRSFPDVFSVMDHLEDNIRPECCQNRPLMMAELQAGWFAGWKSVPYETIQKSLGRDHIGLITRSFLGQGGTIFNHYKAIGGTNWGHLGATDAYTSYDFSAPISEQGLSTERLFEAKRMNLLLSHFDLSQTDRVPPESLALASHEALYTLRNDVTQPGAHWLFLRNLAEQPAQVPLPFGLTCHMHPYQARILPLAIPLKNGWTLQASTMEPLVQTDHVLMVAHQPYGQLILTPTTPVVSLASAEQLRCETLSDGSLKITSPAELAADGLHWVRLDQLTVFILPDYQADRLWQTQSGYYIGPDRVTHEADMVQYAASPLWFVHPNGEWREREPQAPLSFVLPALSHWQCQAGGKPLFRSDAFKPFVQGQSDMDANGFYDGAVWYRYTFDGMAKNISIQAQHIWAVYVNGNCLTANHTFHVHPDTMGPQDEVTLALPSDWLYTDRPNTLKIFVESLGHHKGFHDDTREPRGVLSLKLDGQDITAQGSIARALEADQCEAGESMPIWYCHTRFQLDLPQQTTVPLGLHLDLDIERVNIILNGVLIGKYWRSCRNQTVFYLPEGVLNPHGQNELTLVLMQFLPAPPQPLTSPDTFGKIALVAYEPQIRMVPATNSAKTPV